MLKREVPLFSFAYHYRPRTGTGVADPGWLKDVAKAAKEEPWGRDFKVLDLYLRANFEIAKTQGKVYEDREKGVAFWRAGSLVNPTSDPLWLLYKKNTKGVAPWAFDRVVTGEAPAGADTNKFQLKYDPPSFDRNWNIHFEQWSIDHIMRHNRDRLEQVFRDALGGKFNEHLIFRAVYGEIQLKRKEEVVLPQWYEGDYQFLMPLFLTQQNRVDLTATLTPDRAMNRYVVKTLLLPQFSYAAVRALVKSRAFFADWMLLEDEDLTSPVDTEDAEADS